MFIPPGQVETTGAAPAHDDDDDGETGAIIVTALLASGF